MNIFFLCLKIYFARILDVSLGTICTILTIKGKKFMSSLIGFIEIFIWFLIVREALNTNIDSIWIAIFYSLGFASGTYIGSLLSEVFINGTLNVQVVTKNDSLEMLNELREKGHAVTVLEAKGREKNNKQMLFLEIDKKRLKNIKEIIKKYDKQAFIVVTESKYVHNGYFSK